MEIAVLGMGRMGHALAGRLLDNGHRVRVYNRTPGRADDLVGRGASEAASPSGAAEGAEVVMTSLTDDRAVLDVLAPGGGSLEGIAPDTTVVDTSTVGPDTSRALADRYPGRFVAAPVLGSPTAVADGQATVLLAGPADRLDRLAPLWSTAAGATLRCGEDPGLAAVVKLLNNGLLLSGIAALAETVAAGQAAGLDDGFLETLLTRSPMVGPALHNRVGTVVGRGTDGWFATPLGAKDLGLLVESAAADGVELPLAAAVRDRYREAAQGDLAEADIAGIVNLYPRPES